MIYLSRFYTKRLLNDWTIWGLYVFILAIFTLLVLSGKGSYDSTPELTFIWVVRAVRKIDAILLIAAIFFSSELYWFDRKHNSENIVHTFPVSSGRILLGKFLALNFIFLVLILFMALIAMIAQWSNGMSIHFSDYGLEFLSGLSRNVIFYIALSFFLQTIFQKKYVAIGLTIGLMYVQSLFQKIGFDHPIFYPLTINTGYHSDFVGFEPYMERHIWYSLYIISTVAFMLFLLDKFFVRGVDSIWKSRWKNLKIRLSNHKMKLLALVLLMEVILFFIVSMSEPFYSKNHLEELRANYEVELGHIKGKPQPLLTKFDIDLEYTNDDEIKAVCKYQLVNESQLPIDTLFVQKTWLHYTKKYPIDHSVVVNELEFDQASRLVKIMDQYQHEIHVLDQALMPGDSLTMAFRLLINDHYLSSKLVNTDLVSNGSMIGLGYFPVLGFNHDYEIKPELLRASFGLEPKTRMSKIDDSLAYRSGVNGAFSINMNTDIRSDQLGITLGTKASGNQSTNYEMSSPMENQFVFVNGTYAIQSDSVQLDNRIVPLTIYHHEQHGSNVSRIMSSMKKSLQYYDQEFGDYEFDHLRLVEFPGYQIMAMSLAGTIVFSENIGFTTNVDKTGYDLPFWITAHEVAHEWWGEKVRGAYVQGNGFIVETLSQYSAAMVFEKEYGKEALSKIRRYEYDRYFKGIKREVQEEKPLHLVEDQPYIHYGKGLLNMYALQHFISEDSVNSALQRVTAKYPGKDRKYVNSIQLIEEFRKVTPDSLRYLIDDLFTKIVLYDNQVLLAETKHVANYFETTIEAIANKYVLDEEGGYESVTNNEWMDIALYDVNDSLIYQEPHKFTHFGVKEVIKINSQVKAAKVVIDPDMIYLDRNLNNNEVVVDF